MQKFCLKSGLLALAATLSISAFADTDWPPETGAKVPGNALDVPTMLEGVQDSLETMLNNGGKVISAYVEDDGPVVTLVYQNKNIICLLKGAGTGSNQRVATSKCYRLN